MHGKGEFSYLGTTYKGDFEQGIKSGQGEMVYITGDIYTGDWKEDKPHGRGKICYVKGETFEGGFKEGKRHGSAKFVSKTQKYEGTYIGMLKKIFFSDSFVFYFFC